MAVVSGLFSSLALQALLAIACVQCLTGVAVLALGRHEISLRRALPYLVSAAAGVLLATACLDLLPDALRGQGNHRIVWIALLLGFLVLFCLEVAANRFAGHAHTLHDSHAHAHSAPAAPSTGKAFLPTGVSHHASATLQPAVAPLLLGSALHSMVDGLAITAAFAAGPRPGWGAAIAVGLHEMPHRLGDLSLLFHRGLPQRRAATLAIGAGAASLVGAALVLVLPQTATRSRWLLPFSAATFLYVALADLIPELHARSRTGRRLLEVGCLLGGAFVMALLTIILGD